MSPSASPRGRFRTWLADNPDEAILRWIFRGVLAATIAVLATDLARLNGWLAAEPGATVESSPAQSSPGLLPSILEPFFPGGDRRLIALPAPDGALGRPMNFELVGGGRLIATGTIAPGISQTFAAEIDKHGDYVKTVVLNSPGGSVADAIAMGRLIREHKFVTEVEAGKYCASSCPLMFAGGIERHAGARSIIGVHQVAAIKSTDGARRDEMNIAQVVSARCVRYLAEMGVDQNVWVRAMETPHDKLFVFKPDELASLSLITDRPGGAGRSAAAR